MAQVWYHKLIQTLIMAAATLPLAVVLTALLEVANQPFIPAKWLRASGAATLLLGKTDWTWTCVSFAHRQADGFPACQ